MAIKCEAIVPEVEVEFPCVMENSAGCRLLVINEDIAIPDDGPVVTNFRQLREVYRPCPPGSKFVIQLTADGTFPRAERCDQGTDFVIQHEPNVSIVMPHKGPWSNRVSGEIHNDCACMFPLPNGTKTTITFCDGQWSCEIVEPPKDWLPVTVAGMEVRRLRPSTDESDSLQLLCDAHPSMGVKGARQLSEVAARFADEQEFPGEELPIKYRDTYGEMWSYEICGNGDLELGSSVVSSVDECDRAIRAIRLYKRHLEAQK